MSKEKEFNLSEKEYCECPVSYFLKSDVKEFIRRLSILIQGAGGNFIVSELKDEILEKLIKLAGDKLTGEK